MVWLVVGLVLWNVAHLFKSVGHTARARLVQRIGLDKVQGLVALSVLSAVAMIVVGWRATTPSALYLPPHWGPHATQTGVLLGLLMLASSLTRNAISTRWRHPQLTGVALWAAAHLISNGEQRSVLLFGTFAAWAVVTMFAINARDGAWKRPEPKPAGTLLLPVAITAAGFAAAWFAHPYVIGVRVFWG